MKNTSPALFLDQLPTGALGKVRALRGGSQLASRLATLGLTPGTPLAVLRNNAHGPLLVMVRETRLALGRGEASKILVERTIP
jgi:Fe2+ transport system protein FeoA